MGVGAGGRTQSRVPDIGVRAQWSRELSRKGDLKWNGRRGPCFTAPQLVTSHLGSRFCKMGRYKGKRLERLKRDDRCTRTGKYLIPLSAQEIVAAVPGWGDVQ